MALTFKKVVSGGTLFLLPQLIASGFVFHLSSCYLVDRSNNLRTAIATSHMQHIKARLFGFVLILLGLALVYINWRQLWTEGTYSTKLAAFGPVVGIGGLFLLLFPSRAGKPNTTAEKVTVLIVFAIGLAAGLVNWYLMDPGFFGS